MDRITLSGMLFFATHGVYAEEAQLGQRFEVDVDLHTDTTLAGQTDTLTDTVNYGKVYESVKAVVVEQRFQLLEALAAAIARELLRVFSLQAVTVRVRKPHAPIHGVFSNVEIEVHRTQGWLAGLEQ